MIRVQPGDIHVLIFALCQGAVFVFWRHFLDILPLPVFVVYWFGLAAVLVAAYHAAGRGFVAVPRRLWPRLVLFAALSGLTVYLVMTGLREIGASLAAIVLQTTIVFTVALAVIFLGERPSRRELAGVALIMGGHVVLNFQAGAAFTMWILVIVAGTASQALAHFIAKGMLAHMPEGQINLVRILGCLAAGLIMLPVAVPVPLAAAEVPVLVLGVLIGPFSFLIFYRALKRMNLSRAVFLMNTQPLFTIAIAILALGEALNPRQWLAALLVLAGAYVIVVIHGRQAR